MRVSSLLETDDDRVDLNLGKKNMEAVVQKQRNIVIGGAASSHRSQKQHLLAHSSACPLKILKNLPLYGISTSSGMKV